MKKFLNFIIYNVFVLLLFLLMFSFYGKNIINSYVNSCLKVVYSDVNKDIDTSNNIFTSEEFNTVIDDPETNELIDEFIDNTLDSISGDDITFNTQDEIIDFLKSNRELLQDKYGIEISYADIDNLKNNKDFNLLTSQYDETVVKVKNNLSVDNQKYIKIFKYVCSDSFKVILIVLLLIDLLLYCLLNKSFIKWMKLLGVNLIITGIFTIIIGILTKNIFDSKFTVVFNNSFIIKIGSISIGIGVVLVITYTIIDYIIKSKQEVKENNEVFEEYKEE